MKRRIERLQPMVVLGMTLGAIGFYYTDSTIWLLIHTVPLWKMLLVLFIGYTILPVPLSMDIRGWEEMHPLNSVGWSLLFEYIANILYAIGIRKLSKKVLGIWVLIAAVALAHPGHYQPQWGCRWRLDTKRRTSARGFYPDDVSLLCRSAAFEVAKPTRIKHAFLWCSLLVAPCFQCICHA